MAFFSFGKQKKRSMNKFAKLIEDYLIETYVKGESLDSSSKDFQIGFQKKMIQEYEKNELNEFSITNHYKSRKLKWDEPFSKKRKMDYFNNEYIPFLKLVKNKIDKSRLEKHQEKIEQIKQEYNLYVSQSCQTEIEKREKQFKEFELNEDKKKEVINFGLNEKKRKEILEKDLNNLKTNFEFYRLIPDIQLLEKSNEVIKKQIKILAKEFNDIYEVHKNQLLEHEIEVFKIHLEPIIYIPAIDYLIPGRNQEGQLLKDTFAILLI